MSAVRSLVTESVHRFRQGDRDAAFFALLETDDAVLPELIATFQTESDSQVRAFLVEVIWQHRQPSAIPCLGEALHDAERIVWQQALDGLVSLASLEALAVLRSARKSASQELHGWLDEAIEQVEEQMRK